MRMVTELKCLNLIGCCQNKHKRMSTDEEQSVEVYEKNQENDPDPKSTEIIEFDDNA